MIDIQKSDSQFDGGFVNFSITNVVLDIDSLRSHFKLSDYEQARKFSKLKRLKSNPLSLLDKQDICNLYKNRY